jgi:hypothetical protein
MSQQYYVDHKQKLLKDFDKTSKQIRGVLVAKYGEAQADAMAGEVRLEYERLIPDLPYVGGRQPFTRFIISTAWCLAMYRVLKAHGRTVQEAGPLVYELTAKMTYDYPWFVRWFIGRMCFCQLLLGNLKKTAAESHQRRYPGGYVYTFVEGDGKEFDWGVDYTECASCKFLGEHGASELGPYLCLVDEVYSEAFGWGLTRTKTLADGYEKCDFRFKKDGRTRIESRVSRAGWDRKTR